LKNHALLLFGPSSFKHWFKSCKPFSVKALLFSEIAKQSLVQFIPFLPPGASAPPLLCSPGTSAAGVMRRFWPPPAISCAFPVHALLPHPPTALALCCWRPTRAPHLPPAASTARRSSCRRRNSSASLSYPSLSSAPWHQQLQATLFPSLFHLPNPCPRLFLLFLLPCVTEAARTPHRRIPQSLHLAQIPLTQSFPTPSPCSTS
jgi:hypothetical protein